MCIRDRCGPDEHLGERDRAAAESLVRGLRELVLQPDAMPHGPLARGYTDADGDGTPEPVRGDLSYVPTGRSRRRAYRRMTSRTV